MTRLFFGAGALAAVVLLIACGARVTHGVDGASVDAGADAPAVEEDAAIDAAPSRPKVDSGPGSTACADAGTPFECLDCCDALTPPGQQPYLDAMDKCACDSCPTCAGSELCEVAGGAQSTTCAKCADATREHFGPTSCHPTAQKACDEIAGCVAAQKCMFASKCQTKSFP